MQMKAKRSPTKRKGQGQFKSTRSQEVDTEEIACKGSKNFVKKAKDKANGGIIVKAESIVEETRKLLACQTCREG